MNNVSYLPLKEGMTWSYSRVKCFEDCPYRWFLKYIRCYDDAPQFYSSYGLFIHRLIEQFYRKEITQDELLVKFLSNFSKEVQGARPSSNIVQKYIEAGIGYFKNFKPFPYNTIAVEKKVEFDIDGLPFVGVIDYLGEYNGDYYLVDNKSRNLKPRSNRRVPTNKDKELDEVLKQLYIYSTAVKKEYGKFPKALCINCFKTGVFIQEPFNQVRYDNAIKWVKESIDNIKESDDYYPYIDYFSCCYICGVNNMCCYWQES